MADRAAGEPKLSAAIILPSIDLRSIDLAAFGLIAPPRPCEAVDDGRGSRRH